MLWAQSREHWGQILAGPLTNSVTLPLGASLYTAVKWEYSSLASQGAVGVQPDHMCDKPSKGWGRVDIQTWLPPLLLSWLVVHPGTGEAPRPCLPLRGEEQRARPPETATQQKVVFCALLEASSYGRCCSLPCYGGWVVWGDFLEVF